MKIQQVGNEDEAEEVLNKKNFAPGMANLFVNDNV